MPPKQDGQAKAQKKADLAKKTKARARRGRRSAAFWRRSERREREAAPALRAAPSRRALTSAAATQALEDKTFGLKNKNKSAKVQRCAPRPRFPPLCVAAAAARRGAPMRRAR